MYQLISTTRDELEITQSTYPTEEAARNAMIEDIIISTGYESLDEIVDAANRGVCGFSNRDAWAETNEHGTGQWNIVEIKEKGMTKERLIQVIRDYVGCDIEASEPHYVRDVLTDTCGCTKEELKELDLWNWLGFADLEASVDAE